MKLFQFLFDIMVVSDDFNLKGSMKLECDPIIRFPVSLFLILSIPVYLKLLGKFCDGLPLTSISFNMVVIKEFKFGSVEGGTDGFKDGADRLNC